MNEKLFYFYFYAMCIASLIALVLYMIDKILAKNGDNRIPEKVLLFFSVFFGGFGSLFGRILFHHKTQKIYFTIVIYFSLIIQVVTLIFLFIKR